MFRNLVTLFGLFSLTAPSPVFAYMVNRNATCSDCTSFARAEIPPQPTFSLTSLPPAMVAAQASVTPSVQSTPDMGGNAIAGFFFSGAQTQQVVQVAAWLNSSISAKQFPDPLLESLKALALVVMNGNTTGEKLSSTLSRLPNGEKAEMAINWDPKAIVTPEVAFANAADRFNQLVYRAASTSPETLNDGNIAAVRDWLVVMNSGFRTQGNKF